MRYLYLSRDLGPSSASWGYTRGYLAFEAMFTGGICEWSPSTKRSTVSIECLDRLCCMSVNKLIVTSPLEVANGIIKFPATPRPMN